MLGLSAISPSSEETRNNSGLVGGKRKLQREVELAKDQGSCLDSTAPDNAAIEAAEYTANGIDTTDVQSERHPNPEDESLPGAELPVRTESSDQDATKVSLFVGDLEESVNEALIYSWFSTVAPVVSVRLCRDAVTRRSLGYAYVNFPTHEDGKRALEQLNYCVVKDRPWRVMWSQRDPSIRKRGAGNIFIKNLPQDVGPKELHDLYSNFGTILSLKVAQENGVSKGYGFVHFKTAEQAELAILKTDGLLFNEQKVCVCHHISRRERKSHVEQSKTRYTNVYVKNLPPGVTEDAFRKKFEAFGEVTSIAVMKEPETGRSRGFGFVNYRTHEAAAEAVASMNGENWGEHQLYVGRAQSRAERTEEFRRKFVMVREERYAATHGLNVYVKNLEDEIDDSRLASEFSRFGVITSAKIMVTEGGRSRGFGFVCFSAPEEATRAITEMNGKMLSGKPLYVSLAQRKEDRRAQLRTMMSLRDSRAYAQAIEPGNLLAGDGFYSSSGLFYPPTAQPPYPTGVAAAPGARFLPDASTHWGGSGQQSQGYSPSSSLLFSAYSPQLPVVLLGEGAPTPNVGLSQHPRRYSRGHLAQQQPRGQQQQLRAPLPLAPRPGVADVTARPQQASYNNRRTPGIAYSPGSKNVLRYARSGVGRETGFAAVEPQTLLRRDNAERHSVPAAPSDHSLPSHGAAAVPHAAGRFPMTISARKLAEIPQQQQKQLLGEHLYENVQHTLRSSGILVGGGPLRLPPGEAESGGADLGADRASAKITGMLLEMETGEVLHLLESPAALYQKVHEAVNVLREAGVRQGALLVNP